MRADIVLALFDSRLGMATGAAVVGGSCTIAEDEQPATAGESRGHVATSQRQRCRVVGKPFHRGDPPGEGVGDQVSSDEPTTVMTSHADPLAAPARRSVRFRTAAGAGAGAGCGTMQSVLFIRLVRWIEARGWHLVAG